MRKHRSLLAALLLGVGVSAGAYAAGIDTQKCGSTQGKALATLIASVFKESARACGSAEVGGPGNVLAVKHGTSAKSAGAFDTKVGSSVDKYNFDADRDLDFDDVDDVDNCPFDIGEFPSFEILADSQLAADSACSPTE